MKPLPQILAISTLAMGALLISGCSMMDKQPDANAHAAHHPAAADAAPNSASMAASGSDKTKQCKMDKMSHMDEHMKVMRDLHEKMKAAKTPEERAALKAECKKRMHEGMSMMKKMDGGMMGMKDGGMMKEGGMMKDGGMMNMKGDKGGMQCSMEDRQQMMEKRMEMMQSMMEMMMENMASDTDK